MKGEDGTNVSPFQKPEKEPSDAAILRVIASRARFLADAADDRKWRTARYPARARRQFIADGGALNDALVTLMRRWSEDDAGA